MLLATLSICLVLASDPAVGQSASNIQVDYTGALFGYFRNDGPNPKEKLHAVEEFLQSRTNRPTLLLGMGDNFGPEFGAALQYDGPCLEQSAADKSTTSKNPAVTIPPELYYKSERRTAKSAHCDNVAGFLIDAGYRAIVPGREDFLYSATWLQGIARKFREDNKSRKDKGVLLLAGNLRLDDKKCRLLFADDNSNTSCVDSSGEKVPEAQDWITRIDLTLTDLRVEDTIKQKTEKDPGKRRQMLVNEMEQLRLVASGSSNKNPKQKQSEQTPPDLTSSLDYFAKESAYKITREKKVDFADSKKPKPKLEDITNSHCLPNEIQGERQKDLCLLAKTLIDELDAMPTRQPGFLSDSVRAASERLMLRKIADEEKDIGYTFDERDGMDGRTLIIGVIGDTPMKGVSPTYATADDASVKAFDPLTTAVTLIRAASLVAKEENKPVRRTIIMAQMQRSDAEEFATRLRSKLLKLREHLTSGKLAGTTDANALHVELILSEAQPDRATSNVQLDYDSGELIPVVTPRRAFNVTTENVEDPISTVTLSSLGGGQRTMLTVNSTPHWYVKPGEKSALGLLLERLKASGITDLKHDPDRINTVEFLFERLVQYEKADVVVLPSRDVYFGALPDEYAQYEACEGKGLRDDEKSYCFTRVALDRVFWRGDYFQRVMMSGQDLKAVLKAAQKKAQSERDLVAQDISGQWLYTFGVVTNEPEQLTRIEMSSERFSLPQNKACVGDVSAAKKEQPYCVNGATISDDGSYWVVTSDSLARDTTDYSQFGSLPSGYHQQLRGMFFNGELQEALVGAGELKLHADPDNSKSQPYDPGVHSKSQQYRDLFHVDIAKWVAGFSIRHPVGGNAAAATFQGVAESKASQTTQQELDLEATTRVYRDVGWKFPFSVGNQTVLEYDRAVQGNLSQKPINANYSLNNFSTNLFFQKRIPYFWDAGRTAKGNWANRELPRTLIVLTPIQYQQQVVGSFLFLSHSVGNGELTVSLPRAYGYSSRIGLRHEIGGGSWWKADRGSYFEAGFQLAAQYNVLQSVTLFTGAASLTCNSNGTQTIPQCFGANKNFPIDATTSPTNPATGKEATEFQLLHATGWYWDVHLQRGVLKKYGQAAMSLSLDSRGDLFNPSPAGASLSTQTRYAFPITTSINFPVLRNFTLSPTYTAFFYENQVAGQTIIVNTFSITGKWFYDRDSRVPLRRQLLFKGPGSQDQTKSAKMK
ncbi:MAG: hypothetical protein LAO78_11090 [Acidobacteriia bacterium]|nr:hypothetical protein [Terriglobia bacterium]